MKNNNFEIKSIINSKLAKNSMWLIILQGFNTVIPLLTLPYITRILSTTAYGEFSLSLNWIGYFQVIVEYGFGLSGARKIVMRKSDDELSVIHTNIILARLVLLGICLIVLTLILLFTPINSTQVLCMLILFLMIVAIVFQQTYFFQGLEEMQNIAIINVIARTISVAFIFIFVKQNDDLYLYCFLYILNYIIASLIGCIVIRKRYKVKFHFTGFVNVVNEIKEGWYLFLSSAMTKIFSNIGITILGFVATKSEVGIYSAISKIPYILTLIFSALSQAIYPYSCNKFANSYNDGIKNVKKLGIPIFSSFAFLGIIIMILNKFVVVIAFGKEYEQQSLILIPLIIWTLFGILNNFLGVQTLVAAGFQKEYSRCFTVSTCIMLFLMFGLGRFEGAFGIASASMCSEIFLTLLLVITIRKKMKRKVQ